MFQIFFKSYLKIFTQKNVRKISQLVGKNEIG